MAFIGFANKIFIFTYYTCKRANVDDVAGLSLFHDGKYGLHHSDSAEEVGLQHIPNVLQWRVLERAECGDSSIVNCKHDEERQRKKER